MRHTAESVTQGFDLTGRVAVVTGASSGLGQECARVMALRGARVVLACRNLQKAEAVVQSFRDSIGKEATARCEVRLCDTSSMISVHALIDALIADRRPIDFLFLNAGVFGVPYRLTDEGIEYTAAANYVGHFLMVHELASRGGLAKFARVVATVSEGAYKNPFSKIDLEGLTKPTEPHFSKLTASPNSKVLLALSMRELTRRVTDTRLSGLSFNGGEPGPTLTDNINQGGAALKFLGRAFGSLVMKPVEEGAALLVWAATTPDLDGQSGHVYGANRREVPCPKRFRAPDLAKEAWDTTEKLLGLASFAP